MPRADDDAPASESASAPSVSDVLSGGLGASVERAPADPGSGALDILPDDLRQSMAELRRPQGQARACRWLFVAAVFLVASVFFVSEMTELYFGSLPEYREEMDLPTLDQSSEMACNTTLQTHSQHAIETFIGALPGTARTFLLTVLGTTLCQKLTAARNQEGSSLAAALLVVGTDGDADTIQRAGWDAIVGDLQTEATNPQSSWTQAREARKLTQRQAISSAVAKLTLWHWSQPVVYLWMLAVYRCYVASLGLSQMYFAAIVAAREVLYLGSTLLATWQCPVFLLMDPITAWKEAENRLEKVMRAAMYVLTPHNYTALCLANRFRSWHRVFLGLAGIQVIADLASCFALAALVSGADSDNNPTALIIGYIMTAFGFLLFFGPLSVVSSLKGAADRTKHSCKRLGLGLSGISLLCALVYLVVLYLLMIFVGFNPLCSGFIGTAADPCNGHGRCYGMAQCLCDLGFGSANGSGPLCADGMACTTSQIQRGADDMPEECRETCCSGHGGCEGGGECACDAGFGPEVSSAGQPAICSSPWPCGNSCGSPHFPGSRLLTAEWGGTLNGWAGKGEGQEWSLCCSTFEGCDTAAKFHAGCDAHNTTLTVAHNAGNGGSNPGNFTFGGFAAGSWSVDACCAVPGNYCNRDRDYCYDYASSSDWLFGLWPGPPQRFEPTGTDTGYDTGYQRVRADGWPRWGYGDLAIGKGAPGGSGGYCDLYDQGGTYRGTSTEICGGDGNWGATAVEVWYPI